jgi:hypothetical protein
MLPTASLPHSIAQNDVMRLDTQNAIEWATRSNAQTSVI